MADFKMTELQSNIWNFLLDRHAGVENGWNGKAVTMVLRFACAVDRRADGANNLWVDENGGAEKLKSLVLVTHHLNDHALRVDGRLFGDNGVFKNRVLPRRYVAQAYRLRLSGLTPAVDTVSSFSSEHE